MRVKRFVGENVAETMGKVKRELGSDAVILQTRQFRDGGVFGLFGKVKVEITAAIEEQQPKVQKLPPKINPYLLTKQDFNAGDYSAEEKAVPNLLEQRIEENKKSLIEESLKNIKRNETGKTEDLHKELETMRRMLELMNTQMNVLSSEKRDWPPALAKWADDLTAKGINPQAVNSLINEIRQQVPNEHWENDAVIKNFISSKIQSMCNSTTPVHPGTNKPVVVALVGPTGVGKTTTIGKLAAGFGIVDKRKVAMITADTYRVAAVEQLKTFGEIIGVPVEVVMTPSALKEAIDRHRDKELIFVDTAGRSPNHDFHMSELQAFLANAKADFTILVMSATTQTADQLKLLERFQGIASHLLFTKLDETSCCGSLLNVVEKAEMPVTYLTTGQSVPDDIEAATPRQLARYVLGEDYDV